MAPDFTPNRTDMKRNLLVNLLFLLLPVQLLAQSSSLAVLLQPVDQDPNRYNQVGTRHSTDFTGFRGVPDYLIAKAIRSSNTVQGQTAFEAFQKGELSETEWKNTKASLGRDTLLLSPKPLRQRINAVVGTDRQDRRVVIVDANNNQDFSDDRVLHYPMTLPIERNPNGHYSNRIHAVYDTLPVVQVRVEAFDGKKVVPRMVWIKPNPYNSGWTYPDSSRAQFHLTLLASESRKGTALVAGQSLHFVVTSHVAGLAYNTRGTSIRITNQASQPVSLIPGMTEYRIGEFFFVNNRQFQIVDLSLQGDRLYLADKGLPERSAPGSDRK